MANPAPADHPPPASTAVRLAGLLMAIQGVALGGLAVFFAVKPAFSTPHSLATAEALALFILLGGALWLGLGAALRRARPWSRTPSLVLEILALPVGATLAFQAGLARYGGPILLLALATIAALARAEAEGVFGR